MAKIANIFVQDYHVCFEFFSFLYAKAKKAK